MVVVEQVDLRDKESKKTIEIDADEFRAILDLALGKFETQPILCANCQRILPLWDLDE